MLCQPLEETGFLSTPSARRATGRDNVTVERCGISIHALREEGDKRALTDHSLTQIFLSTPSARRATSYSRSGPTSGREFLSTPSARRATVAVKNAAQVVDISIHALREEGD